MQLAYKPHKGVDDATITLMNITVKHLEGNTSATVCWVFFDLQHNSVSHFNQKATGIPQDVCFYPYLLSVIYYLFHTQICVYRVGYESRLILKYQDDSVIVSQLQDNEPNRGTVLDDFVKK